MAVGEKYCAAKEHSVPDVHVLEAKRMDKNKDLSDFNKGKLVMRRRLGYSFTITRAPVMSHSWVSRVLKVVRMSGGF